jgi:hypothetical protein
MPVVNLLPSYDESHALSCSVVTISYHLNLYIHFSNMSWQGKLISPYSMRIRVQDLS